VVDDARAVQAIANRLSSLVTRRPLLSSSPLQHFVITVAGMKAARKRGTYVGRPKALAGSRLAEAGRILAAGKSQIETARI
jgi:hypothetical protein